MAKARQPRRSRQKAVFLDRDGVINYDAGFVHRRADFLFLPGVIEALLSVPSEYKKIIVSNQSGIGRGFFSQGQARRLNDWVLRCLDSQGVVIDDLFLCPHAPHERCDCRKPRLGLYYQAQRRWAISFRDSWVIGDKESDLLAGEELGCGTVLVNRNRVESLNSPGVRPDFRVPGLKEAVEIIRAHNQDSRS